MNCDASTSLAVARAACVPQVFISTGAGNKDILTFEVLGSIIEAMRPALRAGRYGPAVEQAVVDIGLALAGRAIPPKPAASGGWDDTIGFCIFGGAVAALIGYSAFVSRKERVRYQVGGRAARNCMTRHLLPPCAFRS